MFEYHLNNILGKYLPEFDELIICSYEYDELAELLDELLTKMTHEFLFYLESEDFEEVFDCFRLLLNEYIELNFNVYH